MIMKEGAAFNRKNRNLKATEPATLTLPQRIKAYKQNNGIKCMFCWADNLQGEDVEINEGTASQEITCANCGASWTDVYKLSTPIEITKGEK
jgi:transcription elongation factor Elf1